MKIARDIPGWRIRAVRPGDAAINHLIVSGQEAALVDAGTGKGPGILQHAEDAGADPGR